AGVHEARHQAVVAQFTKRDTAHLELAVVTTRATGDFTTVADADFRRIARKSGKFELCTKTLFNRIRLIHDGSLQGRALGRIAVHELTALVILFGCAGLCHFRILYSLPLLPEREVEGLEQSPCLVVRLCSRT